MRETIKTWCEFSKPATAVIATARRKGYHCPPVDVAVAADVWDIPFDVAFSRRDIIEEKNNFKYLNDGVTRVKIIRGEFMEMDSSNMSHAGAYYRVKVELFKDEAVACELIEA